MLTLFVDVMASGNGPRGDLGRGVHPDAHLQGPCAHQARDDFKS